MRIILQTVSRTANEILGVKGLMSVIQFLRCWLGEFGFGSTNNPLIDFFSFSHYLSAWFHVDTVRRNSILVTHGSLRVKLGTVILFLNSQTTQQNTFYIFQMTNLRQFPTS